MYIIPIILVVIVGAATSFIETLLDMDGRYNERLWSNFVKSISISLDSAVDSNHPGTSLPPMSERVCFGPVQATCEWREKDER